MRKFYQTKWHGIDFETIGPLSLSELPTDNFYKKFYTEFSKKYSNLSELDSSWIKLKVNAANWLVRELMSLDKQTTLSIGVGLGILENHIINKIDIDLHVHEVSDSVRKYFDDDFPNNHIHVGNYPECIPKNLKFDTIIMGGIEYIFDDVSLERLASEVHRHLKPEGRLLMISWSFYKPSILSAAKYWAKECLVKLNFYRKSLQFWGFLRTKKELQYLFGRSGFDLLSSQEDRSVGEWNTLLLSFLKKGD